MRSRRASLVAGLVWVAVVLAGCSPAADEPDAATTGVGDPGGATGSPTSASADPPAGPDDGADTATSTATSPATEAPPADDGAEAGLVPGLPSAAELDRARADVAALTTAELAGQLVVASYPGTDAAAAADLVARHHLAGVITLGDNVPATPAERVPALQALTRSVGEAVAADGRDWPPLLGIDQEGGPITRVGAPLQRWPSAMALGAAADADLAREVAYASGRDLRALGYTVVFAPVADVTTGPDDPTIGARSPGSDPELVAAVAAGQAAGYAEAGVVPVAKHFPGHGSVTADTHVGSALQEADLDTLRQRDLAPFADLVAAGIPGVMSAHIVVSAVDDAAPATLSQEVLTGLLREELGFTGVVVTDALNMAAVSDAHGPGEAAVLAVQAGADVVLMPPDPAAAVAGLAAAVERGDLTRERLEESAARVVATLRSRADVPVPQDVGLHGGATLAERASAAAITQLSGPCGEPLVGDAVQVTGGSELDRALLVEAAREAGLGIGSGEVVALVGAPGYRAGGGGDGATAASGDVVVSLDVPYPLADSTAGTALLAAYGRDEATMRALVDVLTGAAPAPGRLPVAVGPYPRGSGCPR